MSYYAITALLARAYQYAGMYDEAFQMADAVLKFKATGTQGSSYDMFSKDEFWELRGNDFESKKDLSIMRRLTTIIVWEVSLEKKQME